MAMKQDEYPAHLPQRAAHTVEERRDGPGEDPL